MSNPKPKGLILLSMILLLVLFGTSQLKNNIALEVGSKDYLTSLDASYVAGIDNYDNDTYPTKVHAANNLLFVCVFNTLEIYSVSNPFSPIMLSSYTTTDFIGDIDFFEEVIFLVAHKQGLIVLDISKPENPVRVANFSSFRDIGIDWSSEYITINHAKKILYLANGEGGIAIFDIGNPTTPILLREWSPPYQTSTIEKVLYYNDKLLVSKGGLDWGMGVFLVLDVQNATNPILLSSLIGYDMIDDFVIQDDFLYVSLTLLSRRYFRIYDINNVTDFSYLNQTTFFNQYVRSLFAQNEVVFIVESYNYPKSHMFVLDVKNKTNPRILDIYSGFSTTDSILKDIFIQGSLLYINEGMNGIQIFNLGIWSQEELGVNFRDLTLSILLIQVMIIFFSQRKRKKISIK